MRIEVFDLLDGMPAQLIEWWRNAVSLNAAPPAGSDMTSTPDWHLALNQSFLSGQGARVLVARGADDEILAVLPVFGRSPRNRSRGRFGDVVALPTELYGGRVACLSVCADNDVASALLDRLDREFPHWSTLEMTLVDDNACSAAFLEAVRASGYVIESAGQPSSPYVALPGSFDEYFKTLKPNFRTEVRRGERRLREIGDVTSKIFTTVADVDQLWGAVCSIERESWKEAAGTSITTNSSQEIFYREFLPRGAAAGQLFSPVLYLDGRPIAHKICLVRDGVAAILKMSYVDDLKRYYPSTVLLAAYFQEVIARGTRFLDFMGVCDDFKMRWTNLTYGRTKYTIYRRTLAGRLDYTRHRIARRLGYVRGRFRGQSAAIDNG